MAAPLVDWGGPNREYRYTLWRIWDDGGKVLQYVGLNPSTADETNDDPTIRKCVGFAKRLGFGAICMTNLFAWRATDPKVMKLADDPVGPLNDDYLCEVASLADMTIAAWGNHGTFLDRDRKVRDLIPNLHFLVLNEATGQPRHPLYIPYTETPKVWTS